MEISSQDEDSGEGLVARRGRGRPKMAASLQRRPEQHSRDLDDEYIPVRRGLKRQVPTSLYSIHSYD